MTTPPKSRLSRRRLLKIGGVAGAALAGGAWLVMRGGGEAHYRALLPAGVTPKVLSEKELAVLAVFCDRVLPPASDTSPGARETRVAERIDRELTFHHTKMREDIRSALFLLEHSGLVHGAPTRFTRLSEEGQVARLGELASTGFELERIVFSQLKLLACFFFYCDERTWKGIHYEGPIARRLAPHADSRPT